MDYDPATSADLDTVTEQLGRRPESVVGIGARCGSGHPCVVVNYPLQRRRASWAPFPTLFWLTCPMLTKAVSRLEMRGLIAELDRRLETDEDLAAALLRDHESYVRERWELLTPEHRDAAEANGIATPLRERGIGGLHHLRSVKCLHLHLAHELARSNTIGSLLRQDYGIRTCI